MAHYKIDLKSNQIYDFFNRCKIGDADPKDTSVVFKELEYIYNNHVCGSKPIIKSYDTCFNINSSIFNKCIPKKDLRTKNNCTTTFKKRKVNKKVRESSESSKENDEH